MKAGEIYQKDAMIYMIVTDYGKFRPLVIAGATGFNESNYFMNMAYGMSPKITKENKCDKCGRPDNTTLYYGELKIANSLEEYLKNEGKL